MKVHKAKLPVVSLVVSFDIDGAEPSKEVKEETLAVLLFQVILQFFQTKLLIKQIDALVERDHAIANRSTDISCIISIECLKLCRVGSKPLHDPLKVLKLELAGIIKVLHATHFEEHDDKDCDWRLIDIQLDVVAITTLVTSCL